MLTDSSLTNVLVVSGVSQIRYRVYNQHCSRSNLVDYLRNAPELDCNSITLLKAYNDLLSMNIPAVWRIISESDESGKDLVLELWVFWFDERHTGKIDANDDLYILEETKVGSFTWENAYSKVQSPNASPIASSARSKSNLPVTVSEEYKWFIKSVRNLVHVQMKLKGAIPLGEIYIFPHTDQDVIDDSRSNSPSLLKLTNSMLCCSYNIYIASTNLIFQPNTRRIRLRPVMLQTIRTRGKKVILSPSGETVLIASNNHSSLPLQMEEKILKKWSALFDIPYHNLIQSHTPQKHSPNNRASQNQNEVLPNLVAIKSPTSDESFYYPTCLIFVSSSSKISPTAMAGLNGLFGFNQGFSEDLGDKWRRWAWCERISNYWEYTSPRNGIISTVLDSLGQDQSANNTNAGLLQKAINEPITASLLMATKSVATPNTTQQKNETTPTSTNISLDESEEVSSLYQQRNKIKYQSNLSLIDFAMVHFAIPNSTDDLMEYPIQMHDNHHYLEQSTPLQQEQQPQESQIEELKMDHNDKLLGISSSHDVSSNTVNTSAYQSPQIPNLEIDTFGTDVDNMVLDLPNRWNNDGMDDMDNFDFGVTEEDFDFFETAEPSSSAAVMIPQSTNSMLIDNDAILNQSLTDPDHLMLSDNIKQENDFPATTENYYNDEKMMTTSLDQKPHILDANVVNHHDVSVIPLQVGISHNDSANSVMLDSKSYKAEEPHISMIMHDISPQQMFVPPEFAPVKMTYIVNDAKYTNGGKFTYIPSNDGTANSRKRNDDYRPDYVPSSKSRRRQRRKSSRLLQDTINEANKALNLPDNNDANNDQLQLDEYKSETLLESDHDDPMDETEDSDSSTENSDSEYSYDEDDKTNRAMDALLHAQSKFIEKLLSLTPTSTREKVIKLDQLSMEYDSPFAQTVTSDVIRLSDYSANEEDIKALDYLCQQAVIGGYPFSGGIETKSSSGFEANEGESAKVIVARRRNLLQKFYGDTIHIPSTPHDVDFMMQDFKSLLCEIFDQPKKTSITEGMDDMCLEQLPLPVSVTVKGPLNVQQYYDLSETTQTHSKYGKYQVKKRRPAEPNFDILQPPNITVSRQEDFLDGTSNLLMFWEKLRLEPYSAKKHISYFVLYPKNDSIEHDVSHFFKGLSTLYETCQLGVHHPGTVGPYRNGLVSVPLLPQLENESFVDQQMRSYLSECQSLGSALGSSTTDNAHFVIYMINPASHLASNLDLSRCFNKLMEAYNKVASREMDKTRARVVLQLMPIEHVLRSTSFGGCLKIGLKEIAFSVYNKCHAFTNNNYSTITANSKEHICSVQDVYAPAFILAKPVPSQIQFKLKNSINSFPTILENPAVLHVGYAFSFDKYWMIIVWTDNYGEMIEFAIIDNRRPRLTVFREAWSRTLQISKRTDSEWAFVIAKLGLMFEHELKAWVDCLPTDEKIAIVGLDAESTLCVNPDNQNDMTKADIAMSRTSSATDSLNASTPANLMNTTASANKKTATTHIVDNEHTKALLLNHRAAYSNKRERISFGILDMDSLSAEDWMIPLASGYMIHSSPTTENPNNELFNCNPLVLEIHLVYNQTSHSAYSTLRDIIKKYHALSYVNIMPSSNNCFPNHLALVERLTRLLLVISS
ncbi:MAG: mediator complex subunit 13 C-terminal-domain-containing protein [Benjaminiella poitrasii]|nr:MAG: mediator complex subunit 13 C-terminal-domain-containing protein [Benjaminiella poitrasii]